MNWLSVCSSVFVSLSSPSTKLTVTLQRKADQGQGLVSGLAPVATAAHGHAPENAQGRVQGDVVAAPGHAHEEDQGLLVVSADQGLALPGGGALDRGVFRFCHVWYC